MKKWTVMLIPHDRGARHSFNLSAAHVWMLVFLFAGMAFVTGFCVQRYRLAQAESRVLAREYAALTEAEERSKSRVSLAPTLSDEERQQIEERIRKEYEARDQVITAELSRLYDLETELRKVTGIPPRAEDAAIVLDEAGGKGGGLTENGVDLIDFDETTMRPPEMIYGLASPSADLIVQEMNLRMGSFNKLLGAMERQQDRLARMPSVWPTASGDRRLSSKFGYRKDPFTKRVRRHDGLDVSAPHGAPVQATAKGTVVFSEYDRFYGHLVKIDHDNGIETWYAHLSKRLVEVGEQVARGQEVGKVGSTGRSTGPHIHYEVHVKGKPVDPQRYIGH